MRRLPALLTAVALATVLASSLTACSSAPGAGCDRAYEPGNASELVTATGKVGTKPQVEFPTPLIADTTQQSVLVEGAGDPVPAGGTVDFELSLLDGSGDAIAATDYAETPGARLGAGKKGSSVSEALECSQVGERFALTTRAKDVYGENGPFPDGIDKDATLVWVVDVMASYLGKADGFNQLPKDGMPTVVTAPDGQPGISVPKTDAPTETENSTIKAGGGATVANGDTAVLHFSAWTWPDAGGTPADVDSSWAKVPVNQIVTKDGKGDAAGPIAPGAAAKVVGSTVGSQLLVVIPASEAYPGGVPDGVDKSSTLIYVIDVLGIQKQS